MPLFAAVLFFFCACASRSVSSEGNADRDVWIIPADFSGVVHAGRTNTPEEYAYLNYLGASWVLQTFYWHDLEPAQGEWNFQDYDTFVDNLKGAGLKIFGTLAYDNRWIHADGKMRNYIPPEHLPDYLEYVRKTVDHFRGRVDAWCVWNEPNAFFWTGSDKEFFELARQAIDAARKTDSEVLLLGGAFNRGVFGLPKKFIRGFFESGAMEQADAVAFHPYELNPVRSARLYDKFRAIVDDYGFGDKIWITELGYPTEGLYPTKVSEEKLPSYVIKTYALFAAGCVPKLFWYQLFDPHERRNGDSEDYFGLVRSTRDYTSKGAEAFRLCAVYLSGARMNTQGLRREGLPNSLRSFYFEGGREESARVLILWNEGPSSKQVRVLLPGTDHTRHDPVSGSASAIAAQTLVKVDSMPVFITWQGGVEKPFIQIEAH
jgi:hypothetical protein